MDLMNNNRWIKRKAAPERGDLANGDLQNFMVRMRKLSCRMMSCIACCNVQSSHKYICTATVFLDYYIVYVYLLIQVFFS